MRAISRGIHPWATQRAPGKTKNLGDSLSAQSRLASSRSTAAASGQASSIMIGEDAGTDDFAWRARVAGQGDRTQNVLQPGEWIARDRFDAVRRRFLRHAAANDFLRPDQGRGGHGANSVWAGRWDKRTKENATCPKETRLATQPARDRNHGRNGGGDLGQGCFSPQREPHHLARGGALRLHRADDMGGFIGIGEADGEIKDGRWALGEE